MNCAHCNGFGLALIAENKATGHQLLKRCPVCYDSRPKPTHYEWLQPMGIDDYQTAAGPVEHPLSVEEQREFLTGLA